MESDRAQLSAMSSSLDDLTRRITDLAARYQGSPREDVAQALFDTERALISSGRQLSKALRLMR